jgi:hypothetical protein
MSDKVEAPQYEFDKVFGRMFLARPFGNIAMPAFIIATLFFAHESVPGWSFWNFGLNSDTYMLLATCMGLMAGFVGAERRLIGALAAGLSGTCAILAITVLLSLVSAIPNFVVIVALVIGLLPGFALYWLSEKLLGRPEKQLGFSNNQSVENGIPTE